MLDEAPLFEAAEDPESIRAAGPAIGPIHTGVAPPPAELRKGVPPDAVLSPLAITLRGLRKAKTRRAKVSQIVVHMTGSGPVSQSKKSGYTKPAIDFALNWYLDGNGGYPHYVIDFNGTIYATCDERFASAHAGWVHAGGKARFQSASWKAPAWWLAVWGRFGFRSPIDLLPKGMAGPNSGSIGIELLITSKPAFTDAQYRALARLVADIAQRHSIAIPAAPSPTFLGHEDYAPIPTEEKGRANAAGGWDPGAHRANPYFSWSRLWSYLRGSAPAAAPASARPPVNASAFRTFRLTAYHVADQRERPTGAIRVPIYDAKRRKIAEASPEFFGDLSLQGSGRLSDGRLINVTGEEIPVSHEEYAPVLAYHQRAYSRPAPPRYSGIVVENGRVTQAFAFYEVPPQKRGAGYGRQNGINLQPFRTLAADIGRMPRSAPEWKGKGGLVPVGTRVYIQEFDGKLLPDGTRHDGWFVVNDTGGAIFGVHFDVFVGARRLRGQVPEIGHVWFDGIEQRIPAGYAYGLKKR